MSGISFGEPEGGSPITGASREEGVSKTRFAAERPTEASVFPAAKGRNYKGIWISLNFCCPYIVRGDIVGGAY